MKKGRERVQWCTVGVGRRNERVLPSVMVERKRERERESEKRLE